MIKILDSIDTAPILESYYALEEKIVWTEFPSKGKQAGLQYKVGENVWASSVDKSKGQEFAYQNLNPFFKDTIFEDIIQKYNLKRTRLMWLDGWSCYSIHRDLTPRIHVPLISNPQAWFLFKNGFTINLTVGKVYWLDTRKEHTALNGSDIPRLHLIGVVDN